MRQSSIYAPQAFWVAKEADRKAICNGCGVQGWKGKLVPDTIWGVSIALPCHIHDWMYTFGKTEEDKKRADLTFLNNMIRVINRRPDWFNWFRRYRAVTYYNAVVHYGGPAFWDEKNLLSNTDITTSLNEHNL